MKKRARSIGESGMHDFVASPDERGAQGADAPDGPQLRLHRDVVAGRRARRQDALPRAVDSLALIQGAVSLWAFGEEVNGGVALGIFQPVAQANRGARSHHRVAIDS